MEEAAYLAAPSENVTLVHRSNEFRASKAMQQRVCAANHGRGESCMAALDAERFLTSVRNARALRPRPSPALSLKQVETSNLDALRLRPLEVEGPQADKGKARAISAGTEPGTRVHPEVLTAMREVNIELEGIEPRKLTDELAATATILITMGCGEACPAVPGLRRTDWPLEDPKGKPVERVREIRDDVKSRISALLEAEHWR